MFCREKRSGMLGQFPIPLDNVCYCLLHAVLRITERLLIMHVEALSVKTDDTQAQQQRNVVLIFCFLANFLILLDFKIAIL